jgi:hypothetical protein
MAEVKDLCNEFINDVIKKQRLFKQEDLTRILKKHNYEFSIDCLNDLSNYYDWLESRINHGAEFEHKIKDRYGHTKEYQDHMDGEWNDLGMILKEDGLI